MFVSDERIVLFLNPPGTYQRYRNKKGNPEEDIACSVGNHRKKNKENIEDRKSYHRIERVKGHFYRRFSLPDSIDVNQINAKLKNGVLEIIVGKKTTPDTRKIQIELVK